MKNRKCLVFVYGTLRSGLRLSFHLSRSARICDGVISGQLYDLGMYPAYVSNEKGLVAGEVWEVDDYTLEVLDLIEGYDSDNQDGLYVRQTVAVDCGDGTECRAQVYAWNMDLFGTELIDTGTVTDYLVWIGRKHM